MISRAVWLPALFLLLCENAALSQASAPPIVKVRSAPEHPIVEVRKCNQFLNFDMVVQNASRLTLRISQIELGVYDPAHQLVLRKSINTDAFDPSIAVIGKRILAPAETLNVFNPLSEFESSGIPSVSCANRTSRSERKIDIGCRMTVISASS